VVQPPSHMQVPPYSTGRFSGSTNSSRDLVISFCPRTTCILGEEYGLVIHYAHEHANRTLSRVFGLIRGDKAFHIILNHEGGFKINILYSRSG